LSTTQVSNLTATQLASLSATQLNAMTSTQLPKLTASGLRSISLAGMSLSNLTTMLGVTSNSKVISLDQWNMLGSSKRAALKTGGFVPPAT
jgi:hypothetical protein